MLQLLEQVPLAPYTTFGVGGPARWFVDVRSESDLSEALAFAEKNGVPIFFLGGGSNLIVSDAGFPGLVLHLATRGITQEERNGKVHFTVAAGEDWDGFVAQTVAQNCAGVECLSGIPGTCGASPIQNIGAYGQEVGDTIIEVRALDLNTRAVVSLTNAECGFAYRTSIFNSSQRGRYIVLSVTFALIPGGAPSIRYADLRKYFGDRIDVGLQETRDAVREIRASKGMLLREGDPDCRSAGSFFKNPVLPHVDFEKVKPSLESTGRPYTTYPADGAGVKLSAAWLVESAGFARGFGEGRVGLSSKHTLALVNRGGATAQEILDFARVIQGGVKNRFGISLHPEPVMLGF
jgi:UDP-N-acetylmuramate dehydrogenase